MKRFPSKLEKNNFVAVKWNTHFLQPTIWLRCFTIQYGVSFICTEQKNRWPLWEVINAGFVPAMHSCPGACERWYGRPPLTENGTEHFTLLHFWYISRKLTSWKYSFLFNYKLLFGCLPDNLDKRKVVRNVCR